MMKCPNINCNADNPQDAKFCCQCGIKLSVGKKCPFPDCGKNNLPDMAKFCPDCGRPLGNVSLSEELVISVKSKVQNNIPSDMILVEGGIFMMGSDTGDSDEKPIHFVTLSDFCIGIYPVTQELWRQVMDRNPSYFKGDKLPVENVSWFDCVSFCNTLNRREGFDQFYLINGESVKLLSGKHGYRLPTEAEWEFAARGGNKSKGFYYAGGNINDVAWYGSNAVKQTHVVGMKNPNELGLYDMSGNVREWCWDWANTYPSTSQTNPLGPACGVRRVSRGGSFYFIDNTCRVSSRITYKPSDRSYDLGFRLVFLP